MWRTVWRRAGGSGLRRRWADFMADERGSTIVLVTIGMVAFLGMVALVFDAGLIYVNRAQLAHGADAAVLAGGQDLPDSVNRATATATDYGAGNGLKPGEVAVTVSADQKTISVDTHRRINLFFARVLGHNSSDITARASATYGPLSRVEGAAPLGIVYQEFIFGEEYILKEGAGGGEPDPDSAYHSGWFGALSLGKAGADQYRTNLIEGYKDALSVGDIVNTETGNMSGPTEEGVNVRIARCKRVPQCTIDDFERGCPQILIVPVIEPVDDGGNQVKQVKILGFAAFFAEAVTGSGQDNFIQGRFVKTVVPGSIDFSAKDYGLTGVKLVE